MAETSTGGDVADRDELARIEKLAAAQPGERSWEAIGRMRELSKLLDEIIRRETPRSIVESRAANVSTEELVQTWGVTSTWIYKLVPARSRKSN